MNNELISIVIPVYNVEKYLDKCLDSVVNQTYKNIEIILVNDGSTDNSPLISQKYAESDSRIKLIHKKNGGLSDARNAGIDIAIGKYITFIDSDDYIEKDYVEYLFNLLIKNKADLSCCQKIEVDDNDKFIRRLDKYDFKIVEGKSNCMRTFLSNEGLDNFAWGKLYLKEMFKDIRYPFGKLYEDVFTTHKIIAKCNKIVIGDRSKYIYRIRKTSITREIFSLKQLDQIKAYKDRTNFIRINYPELIDLSSKGIVFATNQMVLKLASLHKLNINNYTKLLKEFQNNYRLYEKAFLRSKSGFLAKLFSLFAYLNIRITIKSLRVIVYLKNNHKTNIK